MYNDTAAVESFVSLLTKVWEKGQAGYAYVQICFHLYPNWQGVCDLSCYFPGPNAASNVQKRPGLIPSCLIPVLYSRAALISGHIVCPLQRKSQQSRSKLCYFSIRAIYTRVQIELQHSKQKNAFKILKNCTQNSEKLHSKILKNCTQNSEKFHSSCMKFACRAHEKCFSCHFDTEYPHWECKFSCTKNLRLGVNGQYLVVAGDG